MALMPLLSACSDNNFKVIGHIPGAEGSVVLKYSDMEGGFCQDSTGVKNGVFEFKGNVDDVYNAQVFVRQEGKPGLVSFFILEPGKIMVDMKPDADAVPDRLCGLQGRSVWSEEQSVLQ